MPEFLQQSLFAGPPVKPLDILVRLLVSLVLGLVVASIHRHTRRPAEVTPTFPVTLVLLAVLIAMVTQVIGDNVARAFSLVGALSIVQFSHRCPRHAGYRLRYLRRRGGDGRLAPVISGFQSSGSRWSPPHLSSWLTRAERSTHRS